MVVCLGLGGRGGGSGEVLSNPSFESGGCGFKTVYIGSPTEKQADHAILVSWTRDLIS